MTDFLVNVKVQTTGKELVDQLEAQLKFLRNTNVSVKFSADTANVESQISQVTKKNREARIKMKVDTGSVKADLAKIDAQMQKLGSSQYVKNSNFQNAYTTLKSIASNGLNTSNIKEYNQALATCQNYLKAASAEMSTFVSQTQKINLSNQMQRWLSQNTAATKEARQEVQGLITQLNSYSGNMLKGDYSNIQNQFKNVQSQMLAAGKTGRSFFNELKSGFGSASSVIGSFVGFNTIIRGAREAVQAVRDVNAAMTELRKVSDGSDLQLSKAYDAATESAYKYGMAISDVISSTADWKRLGYSMEDAESLASVTTLLQRVGDNMTQESASEGLISILRGFGKEADEAERIVDSVNEVANTQPIDTAGIVDALQRSASSLSAAGNTLDESIAMVTAANSVVQDPDSVGTAFKTISMRIRGAKTELEAAGEDTEGMAESTASLRQELLALADVDIMKDANTFKSTYQILDELADKWQNLTDIQQASITELVAGSGIYQYVQKCA